MLSGSFDVFGGSATSRGEGGRYLELGGDVSGDGSADETVGFHLALGCDIFSEASIGAGYIFTIFIGGCKATKVSGAKDSAPPLLVVGRTLKDGKFWYGSSEIA